MSISKFSLISLLSFTMAWVAPPAANAEDGNQLFAQGVTAFQTGDFATALQHFTQAQIEGLDTPALWYNLGVTYYKLQRYDDAAGTFEKLAAFDTMRQIAHYNLGLVALHQDRTEDARHWFTLSMKGSDGKINDLAATALERLGKNPQRKAGNAWHGFGQMRYAHDDNVARANEDINGNIPLEDFYWELLAATDYPVLGSRKDGLVMGASVYQQRYRHESDYDFQHGRLYAQWNFPVGAWPTRLFVDTDQARFGGKDFQSSVNGGVQTELRTHGPLGSVRMRYRASQIQSDNSKYDYLQGTVQQVRVSSRSYLRKNRLYIEYTYENHDREDLVVHVPENPSTNRAAYDNFYSYSPTRQQLRTALKVPFATHWSGELDLRYRISDYHDAHSINGTSTKRHDDRSNASLEIRRNFGRQWSVGLEYNTMRNDSNMNRYDYTRNVMSLSGNYSF